jgi:hypothetical protein
MTALAIPVKLITGFRLLGHPVGWPTFAADFFSSCITAIKESITSISHPITIEQTKLKQ